MSYGTSGGSGRIKDRRSSCVVLAGFLAVGCVFVAGTVGCNGDKKGGGASASASSGVTAKTAPSAQANGSASAPVASAGASAAAGPPSAEAQGTGVSGFIAAGQTDACKAQMTQVADYLQRGEVSLAGHDDSIAAAWLIKLSARVCRVFERWKTSCARARHRNSERNRAAPLFEWTWMDPGVVRFTGARVCQAALGNGAATDN
jgi:hypothetical protein